MTLICQVGGEGTNLLTCPEVEGGGYQCEVIGPHSDHIVGRHTIQHALSGNGYSCLSIEQLLLVKS